MICRFDLSELLIEDESIPARDTAPIDASAPLSSSAGDAYHLLSHTSLVSHGTLSMQ